MRSVNEALRLIVALEKAVVVVVRSILKTREERVVIFLFAFA